MNENLENYRNYVKYERAYSDNTVGAYMNDLNKYEEFLNSQTRYAMLKKINPEHADNLLKETKENAIKRFEHYKKLSEN